jgi:hypothetical protein
VPSGHDGAAATAVHGSNTAATHRHSSSH